MTTISKDNKFITLINIFTSNSQAAGTRGLAHPRYQDFDVSYPRLHLRELHRSIDGTKVANYAQWRSVEDFQAMLKNPTALPHMQQAAALAKFEPGLYEVVETHSNEICLIGSPGELPSRVPRHLTRGSRSDSARSQ